MQEENYSPSAPVQSNPEQSSSPYLIPASIVVAGLLIAGAVYYSNLDSGSRNSVGSPPAGGSVAAVGSTAGSVVANPRDLEDDDPVLGDPNAPVTIVEFSDFQCPFCRSLWKSTFPSLRQKYLVTGKAKFIYRDFPLSFHPGAQPAAEAGECADEQGKFWEMHDKIFGEQEKLGSGTVQFTVDDLKKWAREVGLDTVKFNECLDSGKYRSEVQNDLQAGQAAGVTGTPGTFVNG